MSKKRNRINPDGTIEGSCVVLDEDLDKEEKGENEEMDNREETKENNGQENKNPSPAKQGEEQKGFLGAVGDFFGRHPKTTKVLKGIALFGGGIAVGLLAVTLGSSNDSSETPSLPDHDPDDDEDEYDEDSYDDSDEDTTCEETPSADEVTVEG